MKKKRICLLFGGKSSEHEVSLASARSIYDAIDKEKYEVVLVGIDKKGNWHLGQSSNYFLNANNPKLIALNNAAPEITPISKGDSLHLVLSESSEDKGSIDVVFPITHGTYGEDGSLQGFLELLNVPYVGARVLGSAVGMDKDVMKRLLRDANIPIAKFLVFKNIQINEINFDQIKKNLGLPFFVKPASLGSSVGVHKVSKREEFDDAIKDAFSYDRKILIEEFIEGREIECSVLGNEKPIASIPGEIIPHHEFYSYEAKYIDPEGAGLEIPAKLPEEVVKRVQELAIETFKALCCEGMARVDFFVTKSGDVYLNEINTLPGFTKISMYPKLWEASGISYSELISKLIELAEESYKGTKLLKTSFEGE